MTANIDLDRALAFVVERIEAEAELSREPLTEEQRFLLNNLPGAPLFPPGAVSDPEFPPPMPILRDFVYERLIALAKEARRNDLRGNQSLDLEWKWAAAVTKLNDHPMAWLLRWAGLKEERPWWDRPLLISGSLLVTVSALALTILVVENGTILRWFGVGLAYIAILLFLYFGSRHLERWQVKQAIEKYRREGGASR